MRWLLFVLLTAPLGCAQFGLDAEVEPSEPLDERYFEVCVQPILTKSCAAFVCHGDGGRPYRLYAPNRLRLGRTERERAKPFRDPEDPEQDEKGRRELRVNYVGSMAIVNREDPDESVLLRKPLDQLAEVPLVVDCQYARLAHDPSRMTGAESGR